MSGPAARDARRAGRRHRAKARVIQMLRHGLRLGVLVFVAWAAFGGLWRNFKVAHNSSRLVALIEGDRWGQAYAANERVLETMGESYETSLGFLGMPWAATIFGTETADPILVLSTLITTGEITARLFLAVMVALGLAVIFGKVFCSHLCPARFMFDLGQLVRGGLLWLRIPLPHMRFEERFGGWVLIGGLIAAFFAGASIWLLVLPYVGITASIFLTVTAGTTAGLIALPLGWWLGDVLMAPGFFCHNLCPQGFLLEQLGRFSIFGLAVDGSKACPGPCQACTMACPYGLSPRRETHRPACDACGQCVGVCPERKLKRRFSLPIVSASVGAGLIALAVPSVAEAHHNKGLPHYGYYENYPQVPTEEHIVVQGRWEMGSTIFNFQGYERADADTPRDVKIFVYLYDLETDAAYVEAADFDVLLDGVVVTRFEREQVDDEVVYSTRETLPETGTYELVANIPGVAPADAPRLEFFIDLDEGGVSWGLIAGAAAPLVPLFVLALLGRSRRGRSRRMRDGAVASDPDLRADPI
jgi:ferredoxin-type protein NapH